MADQLTTQQFAVMVAKYSDHIQKLATMDDIESAYDEASRRLANRQEELRAAGEGIASAWGQAGDILSTARYEAAQIESKAKEDAAEVLMKASAAGRQIIVNATGDAESQKAILQRDINDLTATKERLAVEVEESGRRRTAAKAEADAASAAAETLKAELSALKSRF